MIWNFNYRNSNCQSLNFRAFEKKLTDYITLYTTKAKQ